MAPFAYTFVDMQSVGYEFVVDVVELVIEPVPDFRRFLNVRGRGSRTTGHCCLDLEKWKWRMKET